MKRSRIAACAPWALGGAVLVAGSTEIRAQGVVPYTGGGYVEKLSGTGPVAEIAFGDFNDDGWLDLARRSPGGILTIHGRFAEYDERHVLDGTYGFFAATHHVSDRMWTVGAGSIREITWSGGPTGVDVDTGIPASAPSLFLAQERPNESLLLLIDQSGARASVFSLTSQGLEQVFERWASPTEVVFHDLAVLDWSGHGATDRDFALVSNLGLRVHESENEVIYSLPALPSQAFVSVLPAADTKHNHDLLLFHAWPLSGPPVLAVANSHHEELIFIGPVGLRSVCFADFTETPRRELFLPRGDERMALILAQQDTTTEQQPVFTVDLEHVNLINLAPGQPSTLPIQAPATAVADLDHDGDEDVLFADDRGLALVVTSERYDADLLRAHPAQPSQTPAINFGTFSYSLVLQAPPTVAQVMVEVWHQTSVSAPVEPWGDPMVKPASYSGALSFPAAAPAADVYQILYRPLGTPSAPVWVEIWSPDITTQGQLASAFNQVYPWLELEDSGPGGTTRRPKISPAGSH